MATYPQNIWKLKQDICEMGRRIWEREYVAANDGNMSIRIAEDRWLCTPTGVSKGFLTPAHIGVVDGQGNQISGSHARTSEIRMHLAISRKLGPELAGSVIHTHAPYATAFALAGKIPPNCIAPEVEVFTGPIEMAPYETPGGWDFAHKVAEHARPGINTILLKNHGVVTWGPNVEKAYFQTEIIDGYCRVLMLASQLGGAQLLPPPKVKELLDLKQKFGMPPDARMLDPQNYPLCSETCGNDLLGRGWRVDGSSAACPCGGGGPGAGQGCGGKAGGGSAGAGGACACSGTGGGSHGRAEAVAQAGGSTAGVDEALIQRITDEVMRALAGR